jgi:hypothetical protein
MGVISMDNAVRRQNIIEVLLVFLVFVAVNLASAVYQQPLTYNHGKGWDGTGYYATAEQFAQGYIPKDEAPFVYRIGTPLLAALVVKNDLLLGFKIVNFIANIFAVILLVVWLRLYIGNWKIRTLLIILFITQWHAPIRYNYFLPASVEPWFLVIVLAGMIGIHYAAKKPTLKTIGVLSLVTLLGVAFKETAILIPIALFFARNPIDFWTKSTFAPANNLRKNLSVLFVIPLFSAIIGLAGIHILISQTNQFSFPVEAVKWAFDKPLLTYLLAWLIAFGPIIVIVIYDWKKAWAFLTEHQFQLVYLIGVSMLAWIGGNDTERYLYTTMPVIFVLLGRAIEHNRLILASPLFVMALGLGQFISQRILWTTPDYPSSVSHSLIILTPLGSNVPYLDLWSYAWVSIKATSLFQYLLFGLGLLMWLNYQGKKQLVGVNPPLG